VGSVDANTLCSGNITFNVSVQATSGNDQPTGTFYLQTDSIPYRANGEPAAPQTSASFTVSVGSAPATLHVRIMFVPFVERARDWSHNYNFYAPSSFRSSQIAYDIALPSGSSCANVTQTQSASLVKTYIQGWIPYVDLGCPGVVIFPVQAFTVPVSNPPSGTFIFNCDGPCPADFFIFGWNDIHGVGTLRVHKEII